MKTKNGQQEKLKGSPQLSYGCSAGTEKLNKGEKEVVANYTFQKI